LELRRTQSRWFLFISTCFLLLTLLYIRKPDPFYLNEFWAEDGSIFFKEIYEKGLVAFVTPYAGYLHLVPRTLSLSFFISPLENIPLVFNYLALLVNLTCVLYIFSPRIRLNFKPLFALITVIGPIGTEVHLTLTNTQWFIALLIPLVLISESAKSWIQILIDNLILLVAALSGPFIIFFFPIVLLKLVLERDKNSLLLLITTCLCVMLQVIVILNFSDRSPSLILFNYEFFIFLVKALAHFVAYPVDFNYRYDSILTISEIFICVVGVILYLLGVLYSLRTNDRRAFYLILGGSIVLGSVFLLRIHPKEIQFGYSRYFFIPKVLFIWSLIVLINKNRFSLYALSLIFPFLYLPNPKAFFNTNYRNHHWRKSINCLNNSTFKDSNPCLFKSNPNGWGFYLAKRFNSTNN
jgi:hypothetical protein